MNVHVDDVWEALNVKALSPETFTHVEAGIGASLFSSIAFRYGQMCVLKLVRFGKALVRSATYIEHRAACNGNGDER